MKTRIHTNRGIRLLSLFLCLVMLTGLFCATAPQAEAAGKAPVVPSLAAWLGLSEEPEAAIISTKPFSELGYYYEVYSYDLDRAADIRTYCEKMPANSAFRLLTTTEREGSGGSYTKTYYYSYAGSEAVEPVRTAAYLAEVTEQDLPFDSFALAVYVKEAPPIQTVVTFYYGNGVRFAGLEDSGSPAGGAGNKTGDSADSTTAGAKPTVPSLAAFLGRTEERDPYTVSRASFEERGLLYTAYTYGVKQAEDIKAYCESIGKSADFRLLGKIAGSGTTFKTTYYYFDCADSGAVKPIRTDLFREIRSGEEAIRESVAGDDLPFDSFALCVSVSERPPQMTLVTFYYGDGVAFAGVNDAAAGSSAGSAVELTKGTASGKPEVPSLMKALGFTDAEQFNHIETHPHDNYTNSSFTVSSDLLGAALEYCQNIPSLGPFRELDRKVDGNSVYRAVWFFFQYTGTEDVKDFTVGDYLSSPIPDVMVKDYTPSFRSCALIVNLSDYSFNGNSIVTIYYSNDLVCPEAAGGTAYSGSVPFISSAQSNTPCPRCGGRKTIPCTACNGRGGDWHYVSGSALTGISKKEWVPCSKCHNSCEITCPTCHGSGKSPW